MGTSETGVQGLDSSWSCLRADCTMSQGGTDAEKNNNRTTHLPSGPRQGKQLAQDHMASHWRTWALDHIPTTLPQLQWCIIHQKNLGYPNIFFRELLPKDILRSPNLKYNSVGQDFPPRAFKASISRESRIVFHICAYSHYFFNWFIWIDIDSTPLTQLVSLVSFHSPEHRSHVSATSWTSCEPPNGPHPFILEK